MGLCRNGPIRHTSYSSLHINSNIVRITSKDETENKNGHDKSISICNRAISFHLEYNLLSENVNDKSYKRDCVRISKWPWDKATASSQQPM